MRDFHFTGVKTEALLTPIGGLTLFEGWGIIKEVGERKGGEDRGETVVGT